MFYSKAFDAHSRIRTRDGGNVYNSHNGNLLEAASLPFSCIVRVARCMPEICYPVVTLGNWELLLKNPDTGFVTIIPENMLLCLQTWASRHPLAVCPMRKVQEACQGAYFQRVSSTDMHNFALWLAAVICLYTTAKGSSEECAGPL